jgi:diphthamide synthase (EF-2-diphthine--ammonia ligase)
VSRFGAAMTLDVYADLFESDLDSVAENVVTAGELAHSFDTEIVSTSAYTLGFAVMSVFRQ